MGVVISNRVYENPYELSTVNFLVGNVGTWQKHTFIAETAIEILGSLSETFSFPTPYTIKITSGKFWKDFGFDVGQVLVMEYTYFDGTTSTPYSWSQNILAINGSELIMDSSTIFQGFSVVPADIGTKSVTNFKFYSTSNLDAISLRYGLIKNSLNQSNSINSFLDSTVSEWLGLGLGSMSVGDVINLLPIGTQSGMSIDNVKLKYLSTSGYHSKWEITIEFFVHGMYNTLPDFENGISPEWFLDSESITDNIDVKFMPQYNNPNVSIKNDMSWTRQLGNVGWFDENYNGLSDDFSIVSVNYQVNGNPSNSIVSNEQTDISVTIAGLANPSDSALKLGYGIMWASKDSDNFKNLKTPYHKNLKINTGGLNAFTDSSKLVSSGVDTTYRQGFSNDNARIDVNSLDWTVSGSNVVLNLTVSPTTEFSNLIDLNSDDKKYILWISIGDEDGPVNTCKRVSKLIDFQDFGKVEVADGGPYDNMQITFHDHTEQVGEVPYCMYDGYVEDDVLGQSLIAINADDILVIDSVTFKIETTNGTDRFTLEERTVNFPVYLKDIDGLQILDFEDSRGFKYNDGNQKNWIKIQRDSSKDSHPLYYYWLYYGFKLRWEHWIAKTGVPADFAKAIELNGFANDWFDYQVGIMSSYQLVHSVSLKGKRNSVDVNYRNESNINVRDYTNSSNKIINTFNNSTNVLMTGGIDPDTGIETNVILANDFTRIEVDYHVGPLMISRTYGTICIEVWRGSGEPEFRQLSTVNDSENDNPLIPLIGQTKTKIENVGSIVRLSCLVDPAKLQNATKFKISSRLGCYIAKCEGFIFTNEECVLNTNNINLIP